MNDGTSTYRALRGRPSLSIAIGFTVALVAACATSGQTAGYNAFLNTIAAECKPLIIGSDNMGQAITFNGLGAVPENYNNFLGKTSALYAGSITAQTYRQSLTAFVGSGTYNERSFDCIVAHLPATAKAATQ